VSWANEIVGDVDLGHVRRRRRLFHLLEDWCRQPGGSIPQVTGSWAGTIGAYRFFNSPWIDRADLVAAMANVTAERCQGVARVLVIQDTTSLDYTSQPQKKGMGPLDSAYTRGLLVHSSMAVSEEGVPLGLVTQEVWAREEHPTRPDDWRYRVPIEAKESVKWLRGLRQTQERLAGCGTVVTVADREADLFELFALAEEVSGDWVVRARHDRVVTGEFGHLVASVEAAAVGAPTPVRATCAGGQRTRSAQTQVQWTRLEVMPPEERAKKDIAAWWATHPTVAPVVRTPLSPLTLGVVLVTEVNPPPGEPAVRWLLLTSLPLATAEDARRCVGYYQLRWLIERFHFVLKSGCRIERLQLHDALAIGRALAVLSGVAWRLLHLALDAREHPTVPCTAIVATEEWQALWATQQPHLPLPAEPPDLRTFVRAVARLGGFLGRTRDGEPGVTTLWRGLTRLNDLTIAYVVGRTEARSPPADCRCV
jgi:hypothetical protein